MAIVDSEWGTLYSGADRTHVRHLHGFVLTVRRERGGWGGPQSKQYKPSWRWVGHVSGERLPDDRPCDCVEWTLRDAKKEVEKAADAWLAYLDRNMEGSG